jgi:hypothetical protein
MPAAPRARQLRRDKVVFSLLMNVVRLHLEESDRLAQQPELRDFPDAELLHLQQVADEWLGIGLRHVMYHYKCTMPTALRVVGEVLTDLKASIPAAHVRQMPLSEVMELPSELRGR